MDVYYMSDCMSYSSMRSPVYRDYEKYPYGSMEKPTNSSNSKTKSQQNTQGKNDKKPSKSNKESCPFCKEHKKRPLGAYLKKREIRCRNDSIQEEEEEEENMQHGHGHGKKA